MKKRNTYARTKDKYESKSEKYKHVYLYLDYKGGDHYRAQITHEGKTKTKTFDTEREAALFVDKYLISVDKPPVNILKPL